MHLWLTSSKREVRLVSGGPVAIVAESARAGSTLRDPVQGSDLPVRKPRLNMGTRCGRAELEFMLTLLKLGQKYFWRLLNIQSYMKPGNKYGT